MEMKEPLKPCPFCSASGDDVGMIVDTTCRSVGLIVRCWGCGAQSNKVFPNREGTVPRGLKSSEEWVLEAVDTWNNLPGRANNADQG